MNLIYLLMPYHFKSKFKVWGKTFHLQIIWSPMCVCVCAHAFVCICVCMCMHMWWKANKGGLTRFFFALFIARINPRWVFLCLSLSFSPCQIHTHSICLFYSHTISLAFPDT